MVKSIFWLGTIQVINYSLPFLLLPILLNRVGVVNYGNISLAMGLVMIVTSLVDFGFNLTGSRDISLVKTTAEERSIIRDIVSARMTLILIGAILFTGIVLSIEPFSENTKLMLYSFPLIITNSLFPSWYFIGKQHTKPLFLLTFLSRIIYFLLIIFFVNDTHDSVYVNMLNALGWFASLLICPYFLPSGLFKFSNLNFSKVWQTILNNKLISLSSLLVSSQRSLPIVIAGTILSPSDLGIYSIADKTILAITSMFIILHSSFFPKYCLYLQENSKISTLIQLIRPVVTPITAVIGIGSALFFFFGSDGLALLSADLKTDQFKTITPLIAFIPLGLLINLPISMTLVAANLKKAYLRYNTVGLLVLVPLCFLLGSLFKIQGIILAMLITEFLIFIAGIYLIRCNMINNELLVHD
ncbi:MAG: oligosaccharide flippase family protein [Cyclobacteriaceae bacterium]